MFRPRTWIVPGFLILVGLLLLWESSLLNADGAANLPLENQRLCSQSSGSNPHPCATLAADSEQEFSVWNAVLGLMSMVGGFGVLAARISASRERFGRTSGERPPAPR